MGQASGSSLYRLSSRDPFTGTFQTLHTNISYSQFPYNAEVWSYSEYVKIETTSNSFGCSTEDVVAITPTVFKYNYSTGQSNRTDACNATANQGVVYSVIQLTTSPDNFTSTVFYTDANLTTPFNGSDLSIQFEGISGSADDWVTEVDSNGIPADIQSCPVA